MLSSFNMGNLTNHTSRGEETQDEWGLFLSVFSRMIRLSRDPGPSDADDVEIHLDGHVQDGAVRVWHSIRMY